MHTAADGGKEQAPRLSFVFSREDVSMDLTMCGLLVERAEQMARLYATHRDWTTVEDQWFDERIDERSTKGSSRKIYRVLSSRFKTVDYSLPAIAQLPSIFDQCDTHRDKAQVLYFYLIEDDPLVKYTVHEYVGRHREQGTDGPNFEQDTIESILNRFHYEDGSEFDYADSTTRRWGEGFRSVMREIDVLESQQTLHGESPNLGTVPLLIASGYSWERHGTDWLSSPIGWLYLFQPEPYWDSLVERVANHDAWKATGSTSGMRLEPVKDTYAWADRSGGDE